MRNFLKIAEGLNVIERNARMQAGLIDDMLDMSRIITGKLRLDVQRVDLPAVSFWAAVPHYLPQPPCPKGTLALLTQVEDVLEVSVPLGDLPEETRAWERGVAELAEEDEDVAEYVRSLEESKDTAELPEASGEAIAREFERYLKRRENPDG